MGGAAGLGAALPPAHPGCRLRLHAPSLTVFACNLMPAEDGMNYCRILDDQFVGSCLQLPEDLDK